MNYYYAQINALSICGGVSQLSGEVEASHMVAITQEQYESASVMGQRYDAPTQTWVVVPPAPVPEPTQFEKDQARFKKRADAKDGLIGWMAADNMARVRAGTWTVANLQSLLIDLEAVNAMMQTLSFEMAAQAIAASTSPLLTAEIKAAWVAKLTEHFYTEP